MPSNSLACVAQAQHYQGVFAMNAVDPVIHCLQAVGRLPEDYSLGMPQCHVPCNPRSLMGREEEEGLCTERSADQEVCHHQRQAWGGQDGPGTESVCGTCGSAGELPGGAYCVDLAGESGMSFLQRCPALQELYCKWLLCKLSASTFCTGVFEEQSIEEMSSSHMSKALADLLLCSMHEVKFLAAVPASTHTGCGSKYACSLLATVNTYLDITWPG